MKLGDDFDSQVSQKINNIITLCFLLFLYLFVVCCLFFCLYSRKTNSFLDLYRRFHLSCKRSLSRRTSRAWKDSERLALNFVLLNQKSPKDHSFGVIFRLIGEGRYGSKGKAQRGP